MDEYPQSFFIDKGGEKIAKTLKGHFDAFD